MEVVRSMSTPEHEPIDCEPTNTATGVSGTSGLAICTGPDAFECGQHEQSEYEQYGLSKPPSTVMLSSGMQVARWSRVAVSVSLVVQTHFAAEASGKSMSASQSNVAPR